MDQLADVEDDEGREELYGPAGDLDAIAKGARQDAGESDGDIAIKMADLDQLDRQLAQRERQLSQLQPQAQPGNLNY